jgi:hypothetical protein
MVQAAFWRGEIQKREAVEDFFNSGNGTLHQKLRGKDRTSMLSHIRNIERESMVEQAFDKNLPATISSANFHNNYFHVKDILEKLLDEEIDAAHKQSISSLLSIMAIAAPRETRRKRRLIRGTEDPEKLSDKEKVWFALHHLKGFRTNAEELRNTPSGSRVYGDDMHTHLVALSKVRHILDKIMDDEPVSSGATRRKGETYISGLGNAQETAEEIIVLLNRPMQIALPKDIVNMAEDASSLNMSSVTLFEAIDKLNYYYEVITITDKDKRAELLANLGKLPGEAEKDILRAMKLEKKLFISRRGAETLVELEHEFADNRDDFNNTNDTDTLVKLTEEYDKIKEDFLRIASTGQGGENKAEEIWQTLVGRHPETYEQKLRREVHEGTAEGEVSPGVHITREPSSEAKPLTYESEEEREAWEKDDN